MPLLYYRRTVKARNLKLRADLRYLYAHADEFGVMEFWFTEMRPCLGGFWISSPSHNGILVKPNVLIQEFATNPSSVPLAS